MKKLKTTRSNEFKQYAVTKEGKLICTNAIKPMDTVVDVEYELLPVKLPPNSKRTGRGQGRITIN